MPPEIAIIAHFCLRIKNRLLCVFYSMKSMFIFNFVLYIPSVAGRAIEMKHIGKPTLAQSNILFLLKLENVKLSQGVCPEAVFFKLWHKLVYVVSCCRFSSFCNTNINI